ncbi:MAG: hypothetical protein FWC44_01965 [Methanomassiliicoccaceae archaeon]|nr:hypothetical protein [Methanomassiliicoccaceae archaeon]
MIFGRHKDVPDEIQKVGLKDWYSGLSDTDKVKVGRYIKDSDTSSKLNFSLSVMKKAGEEENHYVNVLIGEMILGSQLSTMERFDVLESVIPSYFGAERYDECLKCCNEGIDIIKNNMKTIKQRNNGDLPETIMCRNYTINVLVGAKGDYEAGDAALDRFYELGLISEEDLAYRKQSHKIHRMQRTFDSVFTLKPKDQ